ncbi:MAG: SUMF1/EgtB/PvdO family nonheme iron enzyme, partial [Verrucomicrobiota bacterium]
MKTIQIFFLSLTLVLCGQRAAWAESAEASSSNGTLDTRGESNVTFAQRTDGSKIVDIYYDLYGSTSTVALAVSYDGGTTFNSVSSLTGDVGAGITVGTGKHIVWNAGTDYPSAGASNVKMRVTALLDGAGGKFAPIPAGSYQRGDNLDGLSDAPVQTVTLSAYYMSVNDTTKAQWDAVRTWGLSNGYTDLGAGAGKASTHPVQTVTWYDVVKWANAASEKEGLTPCYKVSGVVYRTGTSTSVVCDWSANGYRLPTEGEWEVAARGGLTGKRFPLGDTLSQSQANYYAYSGYSYDLSGSVNNYHPTYATGGTPYTSPVGSFAANGYGLTDMAGNVFQWCWDWYGTTVAESDPRGASTGSDRVLRGGYWRNNADVARCAQRNGFTPDYAGLNDNFGFRLARGRSSSSSSGTQSSGGVVDTTAPAVSAPGAVSVSATSASGASVTFSGASGTDNVGSPTITYSPASGSTFAVGNTTVTVTATDSVGNTATGTFTVTVTDTTAPTITPPSNITVEATSASGTVVNYTATVTDDVGVASLVTSAASFNYPVGVTVDASGNVYVADSSNNTIRQVTSAGVVTTLAGSAGLSGSTDGTASSARFYQAGWVTVDVSGNVFVADRFNNTIRKITSDGVVTTLAGSAGLSGSTDGTASAARFNNPLGVAVDSSGNIFVADNGNHTIRKITSAGVVSTLAGSAGLSGSRDDTGSAARFNRPFGVAVDVSGNVFVTDTGNNTIRKITGAGVVTTLAGSASLGWGSTDGTGSAATFNGPYGVAVDVSGNVYVADSGNNTIRKITGAGVVT